MLENGNVFRTLNAQSAELGMRALPFFFPETSTETPEFQWQSVQAAHPQPGLPSGGAQLSPYLGAMAGAIPLNPVQDQEWFC